MYSLSMYLVCGVTGRPLISVRIRLTCLNQAEMPSAGSGVVRIDPLRFLAV